MVIGQPLQFYILFVMKVLYTLIIASAIQFACYGQMNIVASVSGIDRMEVMRNSVQIDEWHEKSFWPMYGRYASKVESVSLQTYRSLNDLASIDKTVTDQEAFEYGKALINFRSDELILLQQYYIEIGSEFNGVVALQFLQNEALFDMMESCRIYETTSLKKYRFHASIVSMPEFKAAKYNVMRKALQFTPDQATQFYSLYARYEEECDALLGEDYSLIGFYAGEATDYTPALAKHLGNDFLSVMKRELKLKEKYFMEFNNAMGPLLASRFLAWEDYYSVVNKMYAWADAP
jgi:hypothetical protein